MRTATVLVIACPHALGLAIPLVIAISTSLGARNGLLVKDRFALERARTLDMVIFDKTGTLTRGEPVLADVAAVRGARCVSRARSAVEADSEHPAGPRDRGGCPGCAASTSRPPPPSRHSPGAALARQVDGHEVSVGGPRLLAELGARRPLAGRRATGTVRAGRCST